VSGGQDPDFRAWASARREPLRRTAYLMCGDWYLADDLVQDAMARRYAVWGRVVRTGDPEGYSRRILLNLPIDERRRPWRRREVHRDTLPDPAPVPDIDDNLCRHSAISLLLAAGVPVVAVAGVMGHDPVITQRIYAHMFEDDAVDAMATLDKVLRSV